MSSFPPSYNSLYMYPKSKSDYSECPLFNSAIICNLYKNLPVLYCPHLDGLFFWQATNSTLICCSVLSRAAFIQGEKAESF